MGKKKQWSEEEDNIIQEFYPTLGPKGCSDKTGRTEASCVTRAGVLGVKSLIPRNALSAIAKYTTDADEDRMKNEREIIFTEVGHMIDLVLKGKKFERAKAHRCLIDAYDHQPLAWWWAKREMKLGKWLQIFVTGYEWEEQKNRIADTTDNLEDSLKIGAFEFSYLDHMIYQVNDL